MNQSNPVPLPLGNSSAMGSRNNWVVQKFGGTSVGKFALNIVEQVVL